MPYIYTLSGTGAFRSLSDERAVACHFGLRSGSLEKDEARIANTAFSLARNKLV